MLFETFGKILKSINVILEILGNLIDQKNFLKIDNYKKYGNNWFVKKYEEKMVEVFDSF